MSPRPITRLIRSKLTLGQSEVLLHGQFGFGSGFELNPFLLLEDPHNDILSWTKQNLLHQADSLSKSEMMRPGTS
jgi:hypothetical protein